MDFVLAIAEDHVPSTKAPDPYMHVFLDAGNGNILAFFEMPNSPPMGRDPNTPDWVQHIAFKVESEAVLVAAKARLEAAGIAVVGIDGPHDLQVDLFLRPERPPAGTRGRHAPRPSR